MLEVVGIVVLCAALVGAALVVLWLTTRHGELVDVSIEDDDVVIRPRGSAVVWSLKREIRVPRSNVADVRVVDGSEVPIGFRFPGTGAPGILIAGSFGFGADRTFWLIRSRRGPKLVLDARDGSYGRIVLEVSDPDAVAARLSRSPAP